MVVVITDDNIKIAVDLWCSDKNEAINKFGHIISWDVSNVTDMSNLMMIYLDGMFQMLQIWKKCFIMDIHLIKILIQKKLLKKMEVDI